MKQREQVRIKRYYNMLMKIRGKLEEVLINLYSDEDVDAFDRVLASFYELEDMMIRDYGNGTNYKNNLLDITKTNEGE